MAKKMGKFAPFFSSWRTVCYKRWQSR